MQYTTGGELQYNKLAPEGGGSYTCSTTTRSWGGTGGVNQGLHTSFIVTPFTVSGDWLMSAFSFPIGRCQ